MSHGWIGVDLDGTLAFDERGAHSDRIGDPIPLMLERVRNLLIQGYDIRIVTARVSVAKPEPVRARIQSWCLDHLGVVIPITDRKDYEMLELWDDRAVQVKHNTGEFIGRSAYVP